MKVKVKIEDIQWDTDGVPYEDCGLPDKAEVTVDVSDYLNADDIKPSLSQMSRQDASVLDELVGDALSDEHGYCLNSGSHYPEDGITILPAPTHETPAP